MKRIAHMLLLSVLCLCLLSGAVTAGAESWELDEVGVTVELPDNMVAFTRDIEEDDPYLAALGTTREELLDYMERNDYYLCAYAIDAPCEFALALTRDAQEDVRRCSDAQLREIAQSFKDSFLAEGMDEVSISEIYPHPQAPFLKHGMSYGSTQILEYLTFCDDRYITLYLFSYGAPITDEMHAAMDTLVDDLHLDFLESGDAPAASLPDSPGTADEPEPLYVGARVLNFILDLLFTVAVYSMPIAAYRYGVRRAPMEPKAARKVVVIYGIVSFVIMSVLLYLLTDSGVAGASILLWGYVNYAMLTHGKKPDGDDFPAPPAESPPWEG